MKTKIVFATVLGALLCFAQASYADTLEVSYDVETERINISGSFDDVSKSGLYSIRVLKLSDDSEVYTSVGYASGESFSESVMLPSDCDNTDYYVSVIPYSGSGATSKDKPIFVASPTKKDDILKNVLSNQTDAQAMAQLLRDNLKYLGLNNENCDFFNIDSQRQTTAASRMLQKSFSHEKYGEFLSLLNLSVGIEMLDSAAADTAAIVFEKYEKYFNLTGEVCYPIYTGTDTAVKNQAAVKKAAIELFAQNSITSADAVKKYFNENLLLSAISNIVSYGEITTHIDKYSAAIPFSLATYNATNKHTTANYIASLNRTYTEMSQLEADIIAAYNSQNRPQGGGGPSYGGGGGGGSSSSSSGSGGAFYSPSGEVTPVVSVGSFKDLPNTHWAYDMVEELKKKGIISGDNNGNFNPDSFITREEFAKLIVCAFDFYDETAECNFEDVKGDWSYKYVASLYNKGITSGMSESVFGKGYNITREDMAVLCANAASITADGEADFKDKDTIADYALAKVSALSRAGIIKGFDDNTFRPKNNATRAQAASIIYNLINQEGNA